MLRPAIFCSFILHNQRLCGAKSFYCFTLRTVGMRALTRCRKRALSRRTTAGASLCGFENEAALRPRTTELNAKHSIRHQN